jgi:Arc/MetJ family transcription regulator
MSVRATVTIDDELLGELLRLTGTRNRTTAINAAIESHVRRLKVEGLRSLAGRVAIAANDDIEAADAAESATLVTGVRTDSARG